MTKVITKVNYYLTDDQIELLCEHFNKNCEEVEHWEIYDMLDELIDSLAS